MIKMRFKTKTDKTLVSFRLRGGEDVPYVARPLPGPAASALTLRRIIAGARVSGAAVKAVARMAKKRFPDCVVEKSTLEFRGRHKRPR